MRRVLRETVFADPRCANCRLLHHNVLSMVLMYFSHWCVARVLPAQYSPRSNRQKGNGDSGRFVQRRGSWKLNHEPLLMYESAQNSAIGARVVLSSKARCCFADAGMCSPHPLRGCLRCPGLPLTSPYGLSALVRHSAHPWYVRATGCCLLDKPRGRLLRPLHPAPKVHRSRPEPSAACPARSPQAFAAQRIATARTLLTAHSL